MGTLHDNSRWSVRVPALLITLRRPITLLGLFVLAAVLVVAAPRGAASDPALTLPETATPTDVAAEAAGQPDGDGMAEEMAGAAEATPAPPAEPEETPAPTPEPPTPAPTPTRAAPLVRTAMPVPAAPTPAPVQATIAP